MNKKIIMMLLGVGTLAFLSFRTTTVVQEPWKAPASSDALVNPYPLKWGNNTVSPKVMANGLKLYNTYCVSCHGRTGLGDGAPGITFTVKPANFHDKSVADEKDGNLFW